MPKEFKLELNENQQNALEQALRKMKTGEGILKNNERIKAFAAERKVIDSFVAKKHPVVKEYVNLHKVAETKSYTNIGRMVRDMKNIAAEQEALKMAAEMCKDENDKEGLMQAVQALDNHPAMLAYEKYIKGLRYMSGMEENLDKEIKEFFEEEVRVNIGVNDEYETLKKVEVKPATTDAQKANQEFQKLTAEDKAREIYSKNCNLSHHGICKQFLGVRELVGVKGVFRERMTPTLFCVAQMAKQGYSIEEITNPRLFVDVKKQIGAEYLRRRESNTKEDERWYMEEMYHGAEAMIKAFNQYVKDNKHEIKTVQDLALHGSELGVFSHLCYDMLQELDYMKDKVHKEFKTPEEFYEMAFKIGGYTFGEGTGTTNQLIYDIINDKEMSLFTEEVQRQLYIKAFLDEIQKDEPNLEVLIGTPERMNIMKDQIETMPEFREAFALVDPDEPEGDREVDAENMSSKQVKLLASMMSQKFLIDNKISVVTPKIPVKVTKDPCNGRGIQIKEGIGIDRIILHDGKQLVETDMPGKMSDYLHDLEKKGLKGRAKDNSDEFNRLLARYGETMNKLDATNSSNKECIDNLKALKEAAKEYIIAKREQKGYHSKDFPDVGIDTIMLGQSDVVKGIFTSRGKDRYQFALDLIERATILENKFNELETKNLATDKTNENKEVKQDNTTVIKDTTGPEIAPK